MKFIMITGINSAENDICEAFTDAGFEFYKVKADLHDTKPLDSIDAEAVFSCNFHPELSEYCFKRHIIYVSWIFDFPAYTLRNANLQHETDRIFIPDPVIYDNLKESGRTNIYYLPFAVNANKYRQIPVTGDNMENVTFVGDMGIAATENAFELFSGCRDSTKGYIDGIVAAQCGLYGTDIAEMRLPGYVMEDLLLNCSLKLPASCKGDEQWFYSQYLILPRVTMRERINLLFRIGAVAGLHTFSNDSIELNEKELRDCEPDEEGRKGIYATSRINVVIPGRQLHGALPLRTFEIMASGGFVLSAYQSGATDIFEHRRNLVLFDSFEDCTGAVGYYLSHEDERREIAENGRKTVLENHTYDKRIEMMKEAFEWF